jgi:hypothetical protein
VPLTGLGGNLIIIDDPLKLGVAHAPRSERRLPTYAGYAFPAGPLPSAAWAAARRAMGTRNGEHET